MEIKNKESIPNTYMNKVGRSILLTAAREHELAEIIKVGGDGQSAAIEELVNANLKLVVSEAYSYSRRTGVDVNDLISSGHEGLMKAVYKYDASFGTKFSTYAIPWIRQAIRRFICGSHPVKIPLHIVNGMIRHKRMEAENENVTDAELKDDMEIDDRTLDRIKQARITTVSLNETHSDSEFEGEGDLSSIIADTNAVSPDEEMDRNERYVKLQEAVDSLDEMKRDIIMSQCLTNDKVNLSVLGAKWGVTGERIRQIREKTLKELRFKLKNINR